MDKNYLVTKSNYFIMNSNYDLSLEEQKIILTLASMVQPTDEEFKPYKFKISEFMGIVGVKDKSKYIEVPKITKELMKKVFEIQEGKTLIQTAWLSGAKYEKGTGCVELIFSPYLKPYMLKLGTLFTQYKLANVLAMKSKYSPRIYEILKCNEFKKQGYIEIEVEELRKLVKAENIYPLYADFKRYIIIQAQKELKKLSDISFTFEPIKTSRKVTSIKFNIQSKTQKIKNDELSIAIANVEEEPHKSIDLIKQIQDIIKNTTGNEIRDRTAKTFYTRAIKHKKYGNVPMELIAEVAEYSKTQNLEKGFVAWFTGTVEHYIRPLRQNKTDTYNNYEQRVYDYDDLERKLLGWDDSLEEEPEQKAN